MQASSNTTVTTNPTLTIVESWAARLITAGAVTLFGTGTINSNVSVEIAGVATAAVAFIINEILHYLKTNKKVTAVVSTVDKTIASDPEAKAALAQLASSVESLTKNLGGTNATPTKTTGGS